MARTRFGKGGGRGPSGAGEPDGSDCFQRLQEQLEQLAGVVGLVERIVQQQVAAGTSQVPPSVQIFGGSTVSPDSVAPPAVAEVAIAIAAGAPPVVAVEANPTAATTGLAPPSIGSAVFAAEDDALAAERARARANLVEFREFDPPTYGGEIADPWLVVNWVDIMEDLFNDLFIEERDKVPLAMHCLEGSAYTWLTGLRRKHDTNTPFPSWSAFKKKFFEAFFPDSIKQQLEIDLYKLRQGSRTVSEYEREFSRLVHCIPYVIRSDRHKAEMFAAGIRPDIYRPIQVANLQTYREVVDRALHVEYGQAVTCAKREAMDEEKKKKRPYSRSGEGSSCSKKPSKHPQSYFGAESALIGSQQQRARSCVICGGSHRVTSCPEGAGKCYQCGQSGHVKANCTERSNVTQFVASAPYTQQ